jgi:hypothetical protein
LMEGLNLFANNLDADLTGTNNTVAGVFGSLLPINTSVQTWNGTGFSPSSYAYNKSSKTTNWTPNIPLNPGMGAWIKIPAGAYGGATVTQQIPTIGNVIQGGSFTNGNIAPAGGLSLLSSIVPLSGGITTNLGYHPKVNDTIQFWNGSGFTPYSYAYNKSSKSTNWTPSEPQVSPGVGFWLNNQTPNTWVESFTVQ